MESGNNTDEIEVDLICAEALACHLAGEPLKSLDRQCGKAGTLQKDGARR